MIKEVGKITQKKTNTGVNSKGEPWTRISYGVNGKTFSTFNQDFNNFVEGDVVDIDYDKDISGKYNNIKTIIKYGATPGLDQFKHPATEEKELVDTQKLIVRQNALTQANYLMRTCYEKLVGEGKPEDVLKRIAEELETWVFR